jgi:hypothetical protein
VLVGLYVKVILKNFLVGAKSFNEYAQRHSDKTDETGFGGIRLTGF